MAEKPTENLKCEPDCFSDELPDEYFQLLPDGKRSDVLKESVIKRWDYEWANCECSDGDHMPQKMKDAMNKKK